MPKDSNLKHNYLNINILPTPIDGGNENDFTYSRHLAKLLRRFVRFAVPSQEDISFSDRELLDDLMRYGSLKEIARLRHVSESMLYRHLQAVFKRLDKSVERWQLIAQSDQTARKEQGTRQYSCAPALRGLRHDEDGKVQRRREAGT